MPKGLNFTVFLSPDQQDRLRVVAFKEKGRIIGFVAQYEALIAQDLRQIVRYDTAHGFAHKDIIHPNGETVKQPLPFLNFNTAFTFAIQDIKVSWKWYRKTYEEDLKKCFPKTK